MDAGAMLVLAAIVLVGAWYFARHREPSRRATILRRAGFGVMALSGGMLGAFIVGDTLADPGGWEAAGLIALWAIPLVAVGLLVWYRPNRVGWLFAALLGAVLGLSVWFAVDPGGARSFEDQHGPIRAIAVFALAAVLALFGLKRTALAGALLLVVGIVPIAISSRGHHGVASLAAASSAPVITGVLYVASAVVSRRGLPSAAEGAAEHRPKAA